MVNKKIKVLSLFDGISCGQVALKSLGYDVKYYASEIDKYAIAITQKNHPDTIQLGDIKNICYGEYEGNGTTKISKDDFCQNRKTFTKDKIDLLIGGSPCQGFSFAGKQLNFEDPRSALFFEFVRVLKEVKPKYFLLENVRMKQEYQDVISEHLGVKPIMINSSLVSAQNRKRFYWTNIPNIEQPKDQGIILKDIVHEFREEKFDIEKYIVPFDKTLKILDKEVEKGKVGYFRKDSQANRVYYIHDKAVTLCGEAGGGAAKMGQYLFGVINKPRGNNKGGLRNDGTKCPTISSNSFEHNNHLLFGCITPDRINKRQNGQRFSEGKKFYTLTAQDKHGILIEGYIRKLTPIECERLQTMIDNYTEYGINHKGELVKISNTQRYKGLGNGWTVEVIKEIFKKLI